MKEKILLICKGFILGIANIIPGVSGGTLAITLGIYEKLISIISNFTKDIKNNIKYILTLGIGIVIALGVFSHIVGIALEKFPFATILLFIGMIVGGMPVLFKKIKGKKNCINILISIITFSIVIGMPFINDGNRIVSLNTLDFKNIILLFMSGIVASASMLLPGISGSFVLMVIGYYEPVIDAIREFTKFQNMGHNFIIICVMGIGILLGIIIAAKLIDWLLKKYEIPTYYGIIGFVLASIVSIFITAVSSFVGLGQIVMGIILLIVGLFLAQLIGEK